MLTTDTIEGQFTRGRTARQAIQILALRKGALVRMPNGSISRITVCDPVNNRLEIGPLPLWLKLVRRVLRRPV